MKILLIGHSIIDHFENDLSAKIFPGGIYYSALGLLSVIRPSDKIYLLTGYNKETEKIFNNVYHKVDLSFSSELLNMPEVVLKIGEGNEREEEYRNISSPLEISKINDWNLFDGILINMITGFDITLDQLKSIRKNYNGKMYLDVHTLSRGVDLDMKRNFRKIQDADEWIANTDIIQCNENELKTISPYYNEAEIINHVMSFGEKALIITKGESGVVLYFNFGGTVQSILAKGIKINQVNSVGCGDIFGAVFFYYYLCSKELSSSLIKANMTASSAAAIKLTENPDAFLNDK